MRILFLIMLLVFIAPPVFSQEGTSEAFRSTQYPLPRFVSLRSNEVYVRTGPGQKYPVQWVLKKKNLPVEIVLEYDIWRKIKDFDGAQGWVHKSLLTGKRSAIINSEAMVSVHEKPRQNSQILAYFEPKVLVGIEQCNAQWCQVSAAGYRGWLPQNTLWGVYEGEKFD